MNVGLTIGVKIANSATAILQRVEAFDQDYPQLPKDWNMRAHIEIDPMLLALSMELALKAWYVFDHNTDAVMRSHNLLKLFEGLKQNSQIKLDAEFRRSVAPSHPIGADDDYGIKDVLTPHQNAFVDWRYMHDSSSLGFHTSTFKATLEMVLSELRKRYRTVAEPPIELS
jgi:hypothetical protein